MPDDNDFSGPFAGAPGIGGNPLDNEDHARICCPKCRSDNFRAWTNDYGVMRKCLEKGCGEEWSGGTMAAGRNNFTSLFPQPLPGVPAPDDDLPVVQYTGAGFRDPSKTFDGDDY
jgi:hypothetical protein